MRMLNEDEFATLTAFERQLYEGLLDLVSPVSDRLKHAQSGFWWRVNYWVADDSLAHMIEMRATYLAESALSFKAHFCSAPEGIIIWFLGAPKCSKPLWEAYSSQFRSVDAFISEVSSFVHDLLTGRVSVTTYSAKNVVVKWEAYRGTDCIQSCRRLLFPYLSQRVVRRFQNEEIARNPG